MEGFQVLAYHVLTSGSPNDLTATIFRLCGHDQRATSTRWAHLDSNQGPIGYEPTALTAELWARLPDPRRALLRDVRESVNSRRFCPGNWAFRQGRKLCRTPLLAPRSLRARTAGRAGAAL